MQQQIAVKCRHTKRVYNYKPVGNVNEKFNIFNDRFWDKRVGFAYYSKLV